MNELFRQIPNYDVFVFDTNDEDPGYEHKSRLYNRLAVELGKRMSGSVAGPIETGIGKAWVVASGDMDITASELTHITRVVLSNNPKV